MKNTVELIYNGIKQNLSVLSILIVVTIYLFVAKNEYCNSEKKINFMDKWIKSYVWKTLTLPINSITEITEAESLIKKLNKYKHFENESYEISNNCITFKNPEKFHFK